MKPQLHCMEEPATFSGSESDLIGLTSVQTSVTRKNSGNFARNARFKFEKAL